MRTLCIGVMDWFRRRPSQRWQLAMSASWQALFKNLPNKSDIQSTIVKSRSSSWQPKPAPTARIETCKTLQNSALISKKKTLVSNLGHQPRESPQHSEVSAMVLSGHAQEHAPKKPH